MKYILFGAGDLGIRAFKILGEDNVKCFADNFKCGTTICRKKVISFDEMIRQENENQIVITSDDYADVLEEQLKKANIKNYIVFTARNVKELEEVLPKYNYLYNTQYMTYTDILLNYQIYKYRKIAIWGSNKYIEYLLMEIAIINDLRNIVAIIDPTIKKSDVAGIPVMKYEEVQNKIDCLIINTRRTESNVRDCLENVNFDIVDIYDVDKFIFYNQFPELERFKNIHKGERVFIVGNGPSLTIEDLDMLYKNKETCFGVNKIHKVFNQTKWRPNYICMSDARVISACDREMKEIADEAIVFLADRLFITGEVNYIHLKSEYYEPNLPGFSEDITKGVYWGYTVTYDLAIQIAAYMGFKEIYLIGIDNNNVGAVTDPKNHFMPDYFTREEIGVYENISANFDAMNLAYQKAEDYSRKNGFRIFNATRGGKLEVFERVNFDELFD